MFASDRELRRPPPGRGAGGGGASKEDLLEKTRLEREHRELMRIRAVKIVKIQALWRGRRCSRELIRDTGLNLEKKLSDIEKVTAMLKASKNISFVPPMNIICSLLPEFIFVSKRKPLTQSLDMTLNFCKLVLIPSCGELSPQKNICCVLCDPSSPGGCCLLGGVVEVLLQVARHCNDSDRSETAVRSLRLLLSPDASLSGVSSARIAAGQLALDRLRWIPRVRAAMIPRLLPLLRRTVNDDGENVTESAVFKTAQKVCSALLQLTLFIIEASQLTESKRDYFVSQLCRELFTCPALSEVLDESCWRTLSSWSLKHRLLSQMWASSAALPPSPVQAFQSGHWLVGNIAGCGAALAGFSGEGDRDANSSQNLRTYLALVTQLLLKYYIPGVFKSSRGGSGIIWMRSGVQLVAASIPLLLQNQMLKVLEPAFCRELYLICLVPLRDDVFAMGTDKDKRMIAEALSSTGLVMSRRVVLDKTTEANQWTPSRWASKIGSSLLSVFGGTSKGTKDTSANILAISRAEGSDAKPSSLVSLKTFHGPLPDTSRSPDFSLIHSSVSLWSIILPQASLSSVEARAWRHFSSLVFSTRVVDRLWAVANALGLEEFTARFSPGTDISTSCASAAGCALVSLAAALKIALSALDDAELYDHGYPLPLHQIIRLVRVFKVILFRSLQEFPDVLLEPKEVAGAAVASSDPLTNQHAVDIAVETFYKYHALRVIGDVLRDLYARWARRSFCFSEIWEIKETASSRFKTALTDSSAEYGSFASSVLTHMPWCIDFYQRMLHFRSTVDSERRAIQGSDVDPTYRSRGTPIRIRKNLLLEDGMNALDKLGVAALKDRIVVNYINEFGEEEKGIDAGGLFKDFWTDISNRVFNPSFGLFSLTESHLLYPNHNAVFLFSKDETERLYYFVGRVLGKALFENLTVQPQFAHFFLSFINGKYNFMNLIDDLNTYDPELYKNLMFLKSFDGDIADLCLSFSVSEEAFGSQREVDLIPGGASIAVTSHNRHRYINCVAKYYLHDRIQLQAGAFFRGLNQVIHPDQLCIFCAPELQVLISGTSSGISVDDLKANTQYAGGYHPLDRTVSRFWSTVEAMEEADKALLLKFVTSCERPPSLGFSALNPPFTIQRVESENDTRLPTASTCFNILKLPSYSSGTTLRDKLLLAIRSGSGFDLS